MPTNTPEARLPLEPEEYPLYSPPKRIGCSALAILPLLLAAVFVFLFVRITPQLAQGMINPVRQLLNIAIPTPEPTATALPSGGGSIATLTVAKPTATSTKIPTAVVVPPTATAMAEVYVEVANTGGQGVKLRAEPRSDADRVDGLAEGTICKIIGPDQINADATNAGGTWRHVEVIGKSEQGWVLSKWLVVSKKP
ncbi:MAG: SH3 domain-containing protein [Chloroflexia bacterium]